MHTRLEHETVNAFSDRVEQHRTLLRMRGFAMPTENMPPCGQAAQWYGDVTRSVPPSGRHVARQLARLAGEGSHVTIPWRSLADAVGKADKAGRTRAYTERGVQALNEARWLTVETLGRGRGASTTFYLQPGEVVPWTHWLAWVEDTISEQVA